MTASGTAATSIVQLRTMIARSLTFRGGQSDGRAASRVHYGRQVGQLERPCAVILADISGRSIGWGEEHILRPNGQLTVHMERDADLSKADPYLDSLSWFGNVADEVNELAGDDDVTSEFGLTHLPLLTMQLTTVSENSQKTWRSLGRFYSASILWTWGDA